MNHLPVCPESPLVTVVIPAYNASGFIESTLVSVIRQTYRNLEVIVVDDGSTDKTAAIVSAFARKDQRIRLVQQPNSGLAAARNTGIRAAAGDYIANIHADDVWHSTCVERKLAAIGNAPFEAKVAYGWSLGIDGQNCLNGRFCMPFLEGRVFLALVYRFFLCNASSSLIHRTCFETFGLYDTRYHREKAQGCEDWDLHLRFAKHYEFVLAPAFLTGYRLTTTNMTSNNVTMARSYRITMDIARRESPEIPARVFRWSASYFAMYLAFTRSQAGDFLAAWKWLMKALLNDPLMTIIRHDFYTILFRSLIDAFIQCWSHWVAGCKISLAQMENRFYQKPTGVATDWIVRRMKLHRRLPAQRWERWRIERLLALERQEPK
jgi:glycosyltransferase involved in cell wall biosynthesis